MYFSTTSELLQMEKMMTLVPRFPPCGCGVIIQMSSDEGRPEANHTRCMEETMRYIRTPAFRVRFDHYVKERKDQEMLYRGVRHKTLFQQEVCKRVNPTAAFLSGLYLLTADSRLWMKARDNVHTSGIQFQGIRLRDASPDAYILFMAAQDLYRGTRHITVGDLADKSLISPKMFGILCEAMMLRRYGTAALPSQDNAEEKDE